MIEFKRLKAAITKRLKEKHAADMASLKKVETIDQLTSCGAWVPHVAREAYSRLLKSKSKATQRMLTDITWVLPKLDKAMDKVHVKELSETLAKIDRIAQAPELESATITVEWKPNRMYGPHPTATAAVRGTFVYANDATWIRVHPSMDETETKHVFTEHIGMYTGKAGGCGYDKQSTAVAAALNQCDVILRPLYVLSDKNITTPNRDLLGYGSGYGILPYIEGGVGVSCYPRIFGAAGYEFQTIVSTKTTDVYTIGRMPK